MSCKPMAIHKKRKRDVRNMENTILNEDLKNVVSAEYIPWEKMMGQTVLVTGATGLIGSLLCKTLLKADEEHKLNLNVIAMVRNKQKARELFGSLLDGERFCLTVADITRPVVEAYEGKVDLLFHCASVTSSKMMVSKPVDTIAAAVGGTFNLLEFAKEKQVSSMVYISSMEMYGSFSGDGVEVAESDLGFIDPLAVRSNYPESKRMCENLCIAYHAQYGVPVKIARLAQTFGAGILPGENRVFAQFARSAQKGEDIVLHTKGLSEGNYCYTSDAMKGLMLIALKGADAQAYNVSNPETHTTIAAMAEMVSRTLGGGRIRVVFDIPQTNTFGYAADTKMKLNSDKLQALGWKPLVGLEEAYRRLADSMKETEI